MPGPAIALEEVAVKHKTRLAPLAVAGLAALIGAQTVQGAKPAPDVQLEASFQAASADGAHGTPEFYADKLLNDAKGPYVTRRR
jgi:hypothetical protein